MSENYVLVYFQKDNTYSVVLDEKRKLVNQNFGKFEDSDGKWNNGKILFRGKFD